MGVTFQMKFYTTTTNTRGKEVGHGAHTMQVTHSRGWTHGVKIVSSTDKNGNDIFHIEATHGSNGPSELIYIGNITKDKNGKIKFSKKQYT